MAEDYGVRISPQGVDAVTGADVDMIFSTKFQNSLTLETYGSGSASVNGAGTVTIAHNLGYRPNFSVAVDMGGGKYFRIAGATLDYFGSNDALYYISCLATTTNLYIRFSPLAGGAKTYPYQYLIGRDRLYA